MKDETSPTQREPETEEVQECGVNLTGFFTGLIFTIVGAFGLYFILITDYFMTSVRNLSPNLAFRSSIIFSFPFLLPGVFLIVRSFFRGLGFWRGVSTLLGAVLIGIGISLLTRPCIVSTPFKVLMTRLGFIMWVVPAAIVLLPGFLFLRDGFKPKKGSIHKTFSRRVKDKTSPTQRKPETEEVQEWDVSLTGFFIGMIWTVFCALGIFLTFTSNVHPTNFSTLNPAVEFRSNIVGSFTIPLPGVLLIIRSFFRGLGFWRGVLIVLGSALTGIGIFGLMSPFFLFIPFSEVMTRKGLLILIPPAAIYLIPGLYFIRLGFKPKKGIART